MEPGETHFHENTSEISMKKRERDKWGSSIEFMLAIVGYAVDLGNVWRFPYICFKNGGGAFLVPYFLMALFVGVPLFYFELALGQYHRSGCISIWKKISPMFKGVGIGSCIVTTCALVYYNTIIAWAVFYLYSSFTSVLPWANCNHTWADSNCQDEIYLAEHNQTWNKDSQSPAHQFYEHYILGVDKSTGIDDIGSPRWQIVVCLILVYIVLFFCLWKGVRSSGKAVWVTATFPYVVLLILLVRGAMLPGALKGITYYLMPRWELLLSPVVWLEAAIQVFYSIGIGFGVLVALASYNDFHHNIYRDALVASGVNCMTSFVSGFVIFSVMGYMAHILGKEDIEDVTTPGFGLLFVVYGQALTTFEGSVFFSIMFFTMIIALGLDSSFAASEAVLTAFCDEFPNTLGKWRKTTVFCYLALLFLLALSTATYGGIYVVVLLENYSSLSLLLVVAFEAVAVCWAYGVERFRGNIKEMVKFTPSLYWKICWKYVSPPVLLVMTVLCMVYSGNLQYGSYVFPDWTKATGWTIFCISTLPIPTVAFYFFCNTRGSPKERFEAIYQPKVEHSQPDIYLQHVAIEGKNIVI